MIKGLVPAIVTPFKNNSLDLISFQRLLDWQIEEGASGIVICGATGESTSLTDKERGSLITSALEACKKRVPVVVGSGSNCTEKSIQFSKQAQKLGADGLLVTVPYYNKPSQEGLFQHYKAINDNVDIPIIIYNNPARSVVGLSDETIAKLSKLNNIKGIKDSTGDLARPLNLNGLLKDNVDGSGLNPKDGPDFLMLTGEDSTAVAFNASGGTGVISITGNVAPKICSRVQGLTLNGHYKEAHDLHLKLFPLHKALVCETNPIPVKFALSLLGKIREDVRLPLVGLQESSKITVRTALEKLGML